MESGMDKKRANGNKIQQLMLVKSFVVGSAFEETDFPCVILCFLRGNKRVACEDRLSLGS